jgi:hypothetical protein
LTPNTTFWECARLQLHLHALDLYWIAQNRSTEEAFELSENILSRIHREWRPDFGGYIDLPSVRERKGVNWDCDRVEFGTLKKAKKDPRQDISIGLIKGPRSLLRIRANKFHYESISPSSSLFYMFRYAAESGLPDPGLKQAFILDFLTAQIAASVMMNIMHPESILENGRPARLFLSIYEFFWNDKIPETALNYNGNNEFELYLAPRLEEIYPGFEPCETWDLMNVLKEIYYDTLSITGLSTDDMMLFIRENL